MPTAALDLQVTNQSVEAVKDSVVVYSVTLSVSSSIGSAPTFGGGGGESTNGNVLFDALIDDSNPATDDTWITSRVDFTNGGLGRAETKSWVIKH